MTRTVLAIAFAIFADCQSSAPAPVVTAPPPVMQPAPAPTAPPTPPPEQPTPVVITPSAPEPPPAPTSLPPRDNANACQLFHGTRVTRDVRGYQVTAYVRNASDAPISFDLSDRCPQGPAEFSGLADGYDYYEACTRGACAEQRRVHYALAPGERVDIASVTVEPAGGNCRQPLTPGRYTVSFVMPPELHSCRDTFGSFQVGGRPPPAQPQTQPAPRRGRSDCPPMPACGIGCPGPMAHDANGCPLCACEPDSSPRIQ